MTAQNTTIGPAGGQQAPAYSPPLPDTADDTDAWLTVAQRAMDDGLIPADDGLIQHLEGLRTLGMADAMQARVADAIAAGLAAHRALDAIAPGFLPGDVVQITALCRAGGGALTRCGDLSVPEDKAALRDFIAQHNGRRNIYFGANPRSAGLRGATQEAKGPDVAARRTAFVDMDAKDAPPNDPGWTRTRAALEALGARLVVETGNGFHAHFSVESIEGAALADSRGPLAGAMAALGSDNVSDLVRLARLPWTVNLPTESKRKRGAVPALTRAVVPASPSSVPRSIADLCAALADVATRLALPGKGDRAGASGSGRASAQNGVKTGWAAPSAALLRMALDELPNDGPFDDRDAWVGVAHAVKGAAVVGGFEAEGRAAWLDWCDRWQGGRRPQP